MNSIVPRRMRLRSLFDATPFEQWLTNAFEDNDVLPKPLGEWGMPRADVRETDKDYFIAIELPGLAEDEVEVKLTGNLLTISGERELKKEQDDEHYHRVERHYGSFERSFDLPAHVRPDAEHITANFDKGILEVKVPKVEPQPVAKIPVTFS